MSFLWIKNALLYSIIMATVKETNTGIVPGSVSREPFLVLLRKIVERFPLDMAERIITENEWTTAGEVDKIEQLSLFCTRRRQVSKARVFNCSLCVVV